MREKILIIQPSPYDSRGQVIKKSRLYFVGLALPLLAALTPDNYDVELIYETIEEIPWDTDATIVGISSMGHGVHRTIDIAKRFKAMGKTVVLGGYMVSLLPEEATKYCDAVFVGDSEETWGEFFKDYEAGCINPIYKKKLESYHPPLPRYDLVVGKKIGNFLPVQAGRGCVNTCSFCSVACLYESRYLKRPVDEVVRDIRAVRELGFKQFLLLDDNIFADKAYITELCEKIRPLKMKWTTQCTVTIGDDKELLDLIAKSGCMALSFGIESISQESLDTMDKVWARVEDYERLLTNIRKAGIDLSTEMVVGADGDTIQSIRDTAAFVERMKIVVPRFYILTPIPGTAFYHQMKAEDRIYNPDMYSYNAAEAVHYPKHMTPQELTEEYWALYNKVFSYKSIFKRTIGHRGFLERPHRGLFYLYINLFYRYQIKRGITPNII
ncbi:MAG: B12-binding domain-containing radical SAM protein [Cellulosilyticaceae bacterium]